MCWCTPGFTPSNRTPQCGKINCVPPTSENENLSFSSALTLAKEQKLKIERAGWNGKNMYIQIQWPDENSKMTLPYFFMFTACGNHVPWLASQTDILADDWRVCDMMNNADRAIKEHTNYKTL